MPIASLVRRPMLPPARRLKRALFFVYHRAFVSGSKIAFGEKNNYQVNPTFTTIDVDNADICMDFNSFPVLPFADASVDVVFSSRALMHLTENQVTMFLSETLRILRPGGKLLIQLPDLQIEEDKLSGAHNSTWYPSKFNMALKKTGFAVIEGTNRTSIPSFLFRGGFRPSYSFRAIAVKGGVGQHE